MEAANLLNFHPLGRSKSYHEGFIAKTYNRTKQLSEKSNIPTIIQFTLI